MKKSQRNNINTKLTKGLHGKIANPSGHTLNRSVFVQEDTSSKTPKLDIPPFPGIDNLRIDTSDAAKLLRTLKCNKAPGPDQLQNN